jgi:hypothetical protein
MYRLMIGVVMCAVLLTAGPAAFADAADTKAAAENARARAEAARRVYEGNLDPRPPFGDVLEKLYRWSCRLLDAERDAAEDKKERQAAVENHYKRMRALEIRAKDWFRLGLIPAIQVPQAEYYRLEAEAWLAKAKP